MTGATLGGVHDNFMVGTSNSSPGSAEPYIAIWVDWNCAGGQTAVVVQGTSLVVDANDGGVFIYEISGLLATSAVLDQNTNQINNPNGTSWSSGATGTTTNANEIWIGVGSCYNTLTTRPGSPWTSIPGTSNVATAGYQIVSTTGTATYAGTQNSSGPNTWAAGVITLQAPAGPAVTGEGIRVVQQAVPRASLW